MPDFTLHQQQAAWLRATEYLRQKIPNAHLVDTQIPCSPVIKLHLLDATYPQAELSAQAVESLMDDPPYWAFCWASGWAFATWLERDNTAVAGQSVIDFGCGSGVAGIAALKHGAHHVTFVDTDLRALDITLCNLHLNEIEADRYTLSTTLEPDTSGCLLAADVFYDTDNEPLLEQFIHEFDQVIVADSRLRQRQLKGMKLVEVLDAHTIPDLCEAAEFNRVALYLKHHP